ncbi:hypothetical protein KSP40_PGU015745 [Platanthera guangdongensis]|uniref:Uncharacterized protein n=1 Tax=Platanthera guangdongensis TaxID=2320717 RepID=A0ABR2MJP4_9ASPA
MMRSLKEKYLYLSGNEESYWYCRMLQGLGGVGCRNDLRSTEMNATDADHSRVPRSNKIKKGEKVCYPSRILSDNTHVGFMQAAIVDFMDETAHLQANPLFQKQSQGTPEQPSPEYASKSIYSQHGTAIVCYRRVVTTTVL